MKKYCHYAVWLLFASLVITSCGNNNSSNNAAAKQRNSEISLNWKMGIALYSFNLFPFSESLQKADSAGVKFVEGFSFHALKGEFKDSTMENLSPLGIKRIKKLLVDQDIKMKSMYVGGAENAEGWKRYFEIAKILEIDFLVAEPKKEHWNLLDSLGEIYKVKIAIHQHAKGSSAYWHPDSVLAAIKGHQNIGACADLGHWTRSGLDAVKCLNQLKGHILGIHLKDVSKAAVEGKDVIVGKGVIDFAGVAKELKAQNFTGMIYMECEHKMDNNVPDIMESIQYFNKVAADTN
ncbi:MAG: sugar phosphate isomerase/epimerase family protein [Sphingobacteriaceae bacterium]